MRWSVLPQDAERLCVQELALSPSSSCQDRGVYREKNPVRQSSFSGRLRESRHSLQDRGSDSLKSSLSSAHQPPQHCQPLLFLQASPPDFSFPITFLQETLPYEPVRPTCSLLSYDFYTWMTGPALSYPRTVSISIALLSPPCPKEHGLRDPLAPSILIPSICPEQAQVPGNLMKTSY